MLNYCPLVFLEASGRNFTPDRLPASEAAALQEACDAHLARALLALSPVRARLSTIRLTQILHPSPASPAANRGWQAAIDSSLSELGVYE